MSVLVFVCEISGGNRRIAKEEKKRKEKERQIRGSIMAVAHLLLLRLERFLVFAKA